MRGDHEGGGERYRAHKQKTLNKLYTSKSNTLYGVRSEVEKGGRTFVKE